MNKKYKNPKRSQKIFKNSFSSLFLFVKNKKKNTIFLVFQYQEDAIRPELSSPARCRILGGYPEPDGGGQSRTEQDGRNLCVSYRMTYKYSYKCPPPLPALAWVDSPEEGHLEGEEEVSWWTGRGRRAGGTDRGTGAAGRAITASPSLGQSCSTLTDGQLPRIKSSFNQLKKKLIVVYNQIFCWCFCNLQSTKLNQAVLSLCLVCNKDIFLISLPRMPRKVYIKTYDEINNQLAGTSVFPFSHSNNYSYLVTFTALALQADDSVQQSHVRVSVPPRMIVIL